MSGTVATVAKDMRTRWQGVYVRHQKHCRAPEGARCNCRPGYVARVWDRSRGRHLPSPTFRTGSAADAWRTDTKRKLDRGELPDVRSDLRLGNAVARFVKACEEGAALTKHGHRYKPRAIGDLDSSLMVHVVPVLGAKRLSDVRRGDVQRLVDGLTGRLSGSRVRSVVNALRSLYRWAQDRDYVGHNPAALVRLPAMNATPRDHVASPQAFAALLVPLELADATAFALAGYATARREEVRRALWSDVDLEVGAIRLGADSAGRKTDAALRLVPIVRPLAAVLRAEYLRQGRPPGEAHVCPARNASASGLLSCDGVTKRAMRSWGWEWLDDEKAWVASEDALEPIGLQEARHSAASWLNAAGVNPKVASQIMGHSTPERAAAAAAGAPQITLSRYTHTLPGDLERARELLDAYLADDRPAAEDAGT